MNFAYFETVGLEGKFYFAMNLFSTGSPYKLDSDDTAQFAGKQGILMSFEMPERDTTANPKSCIPLDGNKINILTMLTQNPGDSVYQLETNFFDFEDVDSYFAVSIGNIFNVASSWTVENEWTLLDDIPVPERGLARQNTEMTYCEWEYSDYTPSQLNSLLADGTYHQKDAQNIIDFNSLLPAQFRSIQVQPDELEMAFLKIDRLECLSGCYRSEMCGYPDIKD